MKKRNILIAILTLVLSLSATASIFFNNNFDKQSANADNNGYESLFTVESEEAVTFTANKKDTLNNYSKISGLGINFIGDTKLTYKNKVAVQLLTDELDLVKFLVDPNQKDVSETDAKVEFTDVAVRLENWDNPNEYVEIQVFNSIHSSKLCWATASTHGISPMGMKQGALHNSSRRGTPVKASFSGNTPDSTDPAVTLRYDNDLVTAFAHNHLYNEGSELYGGYTGMVRTFNKSTNILGGEELFFGFKCDYVKLSIKFTGVSNINGGNIMLLKVLDQDFSNSANGDVNDVKEPNIFYDYNFENGIPLAELNTDYPTYPLSVYDAIDGVIDTVNYSLYYKGVLGDEEKQLVLQKDNLVKFVPDKVGYYELQILATDNAGNSKTDVFEIKCVNAVEVLKCTLNSQVKTQGNIGETISIPTYKIQGGSGVVNESVTVVDPTGNYVNVSGGYLKLEKIGCYQIKFSFSDYLGYELNLIKQVRVNINSAPIIEETVVPKYLKKNHYVVLNMPKAYDYSSFLGEVKEAPVKLLVAENDANGTYTEITKNEDGLYTYMPSSNATSLFVKYQTSALLDNNNVTTTEPKEIKIVEITFSDYGPENISDYFIVTGGITKNYEEVYGATTSDEEIYFNVTEKGSTIEFLNALRSAGLNFKLNLDPVTSNFKKISVVMQDTVNPNEVVTVSVTKHPTVINKLLYTTIGGDEGSTNGNLINNSDATKTVRFYINNKTKLVDDSNVQILNITKFDNGDEFNGFTSNKIYVKIVFDDFDEDLVNKVRITDFYSIHALYYGALDLGYPIISADKTIPLYAKLNDYITIPSAKAYDDLTPNCDVYVTLKDPNGNYVLGSASEPLKANKDYTVFVNVPGKYFLSYSSTDENDEPFNDTLVINTLDTIVPIIEIDGQIKSSVKLGSVLEIPDIAVIDNSTAEEGLNYYVYLETPSYGRKIIVVNERRETFVFKEKGEYRLIVFAIDASGNFAQKDFKITVTN